MYIKLTLKESPLGHTSIVKVDGQCRICSRRQFLVGIDRIPTRSPPYRDVTRPSYPMSVNRISNIYIKC